MLLSINKITKTVNKIKESSDRNRWKYIQLSKENMQWMQEGTFEIQTSMHERSSEIKKPSHKDVNKLIRLFRNAFEQLA